MREKIWANAPDRSFKDRRSYEWSRYNWRPKSAWKKLEKDYIINDAKADFIRIRNRDIIYGKEESE